MLKCILKIFRPLTAKYQSSFVRVCTWTISPIDTIFIIKHSLINLNNINFMIFQLYLRELGGEQADRHMDKQKYGPRDVKADKPNA